MALPSLTDDELRIDKVKVPCYRCGHLLEINMERGCKPPPKLCSICASIDPYGFAYGDMVNPNTLRHVKPWDKSKGETQTVIIYRPGDRGFDQLAALYSPPTGCKVKSTIRPMDRFKDDFMNTSLLPEE